MSIAEAKGLDAKAAMSLAHKFFREFFPDTTITNVLLEELEFDETRSVWEVTIGFDVGRRKVRQPSRNALAMFAEEEVEPIREARMFVISDSDGSLVSIRNN